MKGDCEFPVSYETRETIGNQQDREHHTMKKNATATAPAATATAPAAPVVNEVEATATAPAATATADMEKLNEFELASLGMSVSEVMKACIAYRLARQAACNYGRTAKTLPLKEDKTKISDGKSIKGNVKRRVEDNYDSSSLDADAVKVFNAQAEIIKAARTLGLMA